VEINLDCSKLGVYCREEDLTGSSAAFSGPKIEGKKDLTG
jgi:hypothetical protein